ncbi:RNA 5'-triphosphatase domain-containing protein [Aspergillus clavatus NRRL 1]|uniref:Dual specificity phosphatase, catalytic domain protein n=1 Tax=Aspergillus clavatus (strain ATCC 1007 / CBS 513.65 / DSM 816 / NCTC 3887 / NRRL 1 / QM 1276 / 107) TaxID=344612 RepID=A1CRV4_ASPCL|nr:dual specificity phosphatase, catalytic domain protein [Aspergillus clavatus NRRL 1]EAW08375.1 dual specificity phosphatase, catalytic domain protein [Aspergillus clavatus NRRL 1]
MISAGTSLSSSTSPRSFFDIGAALQLWDSVSATLSHSTAFLGFSRSFHTLDADGTITWGKVVFLTTCLITMAGCGFLSSLVRRRVFKRSRDRKPLRRGAQKEHSTSVAGTTTSSEEEEDDYDSSGSLRFGTNAAMPQEKVTHKQREQSTDALSTDPGLLKKRSSFLSYTTSIATYPSIRTFFCPHPQMDKLPTKPTPLPLLVFVHGLGGSLAQFGLLLTSLANVGPCFGIDLPGCGLSTFAPTSWDAYTVEALAELLCTAIEKHRDREAGQKVVLIGHSLGCSLSALLASSTSPIGAELKQHISGLLAICPRAAPPTPDEVASFRRLLHVPETIFDMWRRWDRRGGLHSTSVNRLVGTDADPDTRELQVRYNKQSKTPVWRRMAWGTLPTYTKDGKAVGGIPGEEVWAGVKTPVLLVAGESDAVTKPAELQKILKFFGETGLKVDMGTNGSAVIPDASEVHDTVSTTYDHLAHEEEYGLEAQTSEKTLVIEPEASSKKKRAVKTVILPAPASHALLYDRATYRTLAGIIQDFLSQHIDQRVSLGWQLQYMNTSGKWDVKNLAKWQKVPPVSQRIADTFVALKMLREVDEEHNPVLFSQKHRDQIYAVIDISYENPVYNPASLEKGGIQYHKHPTVSKIPPTPDETRDFIALVDRLQNEITEKMKKSGNTSGPRPVVGVHCHYGFNRTGFLIVSYLIERRGFTVQEAIDEFERQRAPGIRHGHFIDALFVRYCVGLKRAPTL